MNAVSSSQVFSSSASVIDSRLNDAYTAIFGHAPAGDDVLGYWITSGLGKQVHETIVSTLPKAAPAPVIPAFAPITPAAVEETPPRKRQTANHHLAPNIEKKMKDCLLAAVADSDVRQLDAVLRMIVAHVPQGFFVTPFADQSKPFRRVMSRSAALNLHFYFDPTEGGFGDKVMKKAKPAAVVAESVLPAEVQDYLTAVLRQAVMLDSLSAVDAALEQIVTACKAAGVKSFTAPYANNTKASGLLIGRMLKRDADSRVFLNWIANA